MISSIFALYALLASKDSTIRGRQRYKGSGKRKAGSLNEFGSKQKPSPVELLSVPSLTKSTGPFPSFFTCRHTYEDVLVQELEKCLEGKNAYQVSSVGPGLVMVDGQLEAGHGEGFVIDPVYAMQILPDCRIVGASSSIRGLSNEIASLQAFNEILAVLPRNCLTIHALVPGMCKGQRDPAMRRGCRTGAGGLAEEVSCRPKGTGSHASMIASDLVVNTGKGRRLTIVLQDLVSLLANDVAQPLSARWIGAC